MTGPRVKGSERPRLPPRQHRARAWPLQQGRGHAGLEGPSLPAGALGPRGPGRPALRGQPSGAATCPGPGVPTPARVLPVPGHCPALPSGLRLLTGPLWALVQAVLGIAKAGVHWGAAAGPRLGAADETRLSPRRGHTAPRADASPPSQPLTSRKAGSRQTWPSLSPPEPGRRGCWLPTHWNPRPLPLRGPRP